MDMGSGAGARLAQGADAVGSLTSRYTTELLNHGRSEVTTSGYRCAISQYARWCLDHEIDFRQATREDAEAWLYGLRLSKLLPSSVKVKFIIVRGWYRWLVGMGVAMRDPFAAIRSMKVPETLQPVLDGNGVRRMLEKCETIKEIAIVTTLYSTGVRAGGFLGMKLGDLNLEAGTVRVRTKGGKEMYVLLNEGAVAALRCWIAERSRYKSLKRYPTDYLWIGKRGRIHRHNLGRIIQVIASRAGLGRVTPHAFRRTFASTLSDQGVRIEDIQRLMGHKSVQATQVYTKYSTAGIKQAWRKLPEIGLMILGALAV